MDPGEPRDPRGEGARRPQDDDESYGYRDPAFDDDPDYPDAASFEDDPAFARRRRSPDDLYDETDEYQAPSFTPEELEGLDRGGGPRRFLPLEDEPTTLVARYLFPTERYRGEWKRHWIHLAKPIGIGAAATLVLGYLAGFLTKQEVDGLVTVAVLIWLGVISWVAWEVFDWYFDRFILTNKRVMVVNGIITRKVAMMPLLRVTDMKYEQSALGRMLSYGTFVLESAGQDQALREVKHLPNPNELYLRVVEEMYEPQAVEARLGKDDEGDDA
ncbi:PH domain-containing protein [Actinoplanes sp. NEAU-A12]|uniref:PH domain-containing protein n=1 Tax=Actinoplanes sandaracinus TaxID=3045177 RepID=A0ABT6WJF3_9ACTN|nr:PH domain-containing protein [Actinoplanes sandaracinus]MDI6099843.1 PH domain-containing protein [Actinoplanes sandaracinus]